MRLLQAPVPSDDQVVLGVSVFLLPLGVVCGFIALLLYRIQHLRTVLTPTRLVLPRYVWGWDVVELRSVAGVGLRFHDPSPPRIKGEGGRVRPMWRLAVWRTDVSRAALPLGVFSGELPPLPSAPDPEDLLVLSQPLAESWPGQVARQIAEQVAATSAPGRQRGRRALLRGGRPGPACREGLLVAGRQHGSAALTVVPSPAARG